MSNFFESLQKAELLGANDYALTAVGLETPPQGADPLEAAVPPSPAPTTPAHAPKFRTEQFHISALSPIFPFEEESAVAAEQYRIIRTKILHHHRKPRIMVVSSSGSGDGKTVTSMNLASSFALKRDLRVALIDADMRRPRVAEMLGVSGTPGLSDVLSGSASFEEAAFCPEQFPNLCILPAGKALRTQSELLDSPRWTATVAMLRETFDYVLFDAPPIATVADYELVQLACDGVIFVARPDHSDRKACQTALATVPKEKLLGVVLNCVEDWFLWRTNTYDYYSKA